MKVRYEEICGEVTTIYDGKYGEYWVNYFSGSYTVVFIPRANKHAPYHESGSWEFVPDGTKRIRERRERASDLMQEIERWERRVV